MNRKAIAVVCTAAFVIAGCAQNKQIELDPRNLSTIHRVVVVGPADPAPFSVTTQREADAQAAVAAAAAVPFLGVLGAGIAGGIAGAISAEIAKETSKPLNDEVAAEHYMFGSAFQDAIAIALRNDGYEVSLATVDRKAPTSLAEKYDALAGQADLVVDAVVVARCSNVGPAKAAHFRPVVAVTVRVIRPGDKAPIMQKTFVYDDETAKPGAYEITGDPQFDIADYDALKANIGQCLAGIKSSVTPLAQAFAAVAVQPK